MDRANRFTKVDLTPRRWHGYAILLFLLGTLLPPLAVAARFGIGKDFFINVILTLCGYIPGHVHNFYIQNIRNNKNHRRTPKWISRYGLVDTTVMDRKKTKSQWAARYADRLPNSTLDGIEVEEGQVTGRSSGSANEEGNATGRRLWNQAEETYYGGPDHPGSSSSLKSNASAGRWHYPANFQDAEPLPASGGKKKKVKKDRWARTEDARMAVRADDGSRKKKKGGRKKGATNGDYIDPGRESFDSATVDGPEDPEGRRYGPSRDEAPTKGSGYPRGQHDELEHEF